MTPRGGGGRPADGGLPTPPIIFALGASYVVEQPPLQHHRRLGLDRGRVQRSDDPLRPGDGDHRADPQVPHVHCVFTNAFSTKPPVPPKPTPVPQTDAGPPDASPPRDAQPRL